MTSPVHIARMLLGLFVILSLAAVPATPAIENPPPACCCLTSDTCHEPALPSSCACTGCPVTLHAQPLAIFSEKNPAHDLSASLQLWNPHDEHAAQRSAAPPVPPPRIPA